jgi:hypothetical protein
MKTRAAEKPHKDLMQADKLPAADNRTKPGLFPLYHQVPIRV